VWVLYAEGDEPLRVPVVQSFFAATVCSSLWACGHRLCSTAEFGYVCPNADHTCGREGAGANTFSHTLLCGFNANPHWGAYADTFSNAHPHAYIHTNAYSQPHHRTSE
jgi:hypothetical protein